MDTDFMQGNPEHIVLGKPDEKPARKHGNQRPKPARTAKGILADIKHRREMLKPLVDEYKRLAEADKRLAKI